MQDIRKPYSRSRSDRGREIRERVEEFEEHTYHDEVDDEPVHIPVKKTFRARRNIDQMDMYPKRGRRSYDNDEAEGDYGRRESDIPYRDPRTRYADRKQSIGTLAFLGTIAIIAIVGGLLTYVFNRATITIIPKYTDLASYSKTISFAQASLDTDATVLYTVATTSLSKSKTLALSETKKVESKASGKIIIYNNYSTDPQRLIKNTRFESSAGKIYRINNSVTVPGKSTKAPGSIEVTVYADDVGTSYNSSPTDFTIPGFKGSPQYATFYARSNGAITGGASGNASSASLSDINAAKDELALELAREVKDALGKETMPGHIGLYSAIDIAYTDNENDLLAGNTSVYQVTATGYLMFAKEDELAHVIAQDVRDYHSEAVRVDNPEDIVFTRKDTDRLATAQSLAVLAEGSPRIVFLTDVAALKELVAGKSRSEFASLMKGITSIEGAELNLSPMWLSKFPEDQSKISIVESLPKR
jgi:hypothetical protein